LDLIVTKFYNDQKSNQPVLKNDSVSDAKWWKTAEDHRFALEVLQLPIRRQILKLVAGELKSREQIERETGLGSAQAAYHLAMLEKALVIEQTEGGYMATSMGILYLEKVEAKSCR
jgi:predicted Rossmann fold nucleotide-binding protein DprA/Smf involved in DNA uptake